MPAMIVQNSSWPRVYRILSRDNAVRTSISQSSAMTEPRGGAIFASRVRAGRQTDIQTFGVIPQTRPRACANAHTNCGRHALLKSGSFTQPLICVCFSTHSHRVLSAEPHRGSATGKMADRCRAFVALTTRAACRLVECRMRSVTVTINETTQGGATCNID
jgi:hypothetical protein